MSGDIYSKLIEVTDSANVLRDEAMSRHTTFRVGGPADYFVTPANIMEAADIVRLLLTENIPFTVIGNGSNILVADEGYRGCVVCLAKGMDSITVDGIRITAGAGAMLSKVSSAAAETGLAGMAFASGIPGAVGGAVVMNAGAYGGEMKDIIKEVTLLDEESGEITVLQNEEMNFGYRTSIVKSKPMVVLGATFELHEGRSEDIKLQMAELAMKRREKQPLEYPSAGSTFKRPEGYFAGKLIEDSGLKGYSVGGAAVSEKHCGFVINRGSATANDIYTLICNVRDIVSEKFDVLLEPEVVMLGFAESENC